MKRLASLLIAFVLILSLAGCGPTSKSPSEISQNNITENQATISPETTKPTDSSQSTQPTTPATSTQQTTSVNGQLKIHYIDVGQADSILLQQNGQSMLIDAGNNADSNTVVNYIKQQGISKLDYVIGTHPHEDHIGGMDAVINTFNIGTIYMPKVSNNTATFKDVLTAIKNKGLTVTTPVPGSTFKLGDAVCEVLGPISSNPDDLNTYSIVIKVTFGNNKFLFMGDAQVSNEEDMINKGFDLSADVLKVGHHGSYTSTSQAFLDKVNPKYAVISCGKGNDYGHPHKETMDRLKAENITVYRTDECGTIVVTSDGSKISFNVKPGDYRYGDEIGGQSSTDSNSSGSSAVPSSQTNTNTGSVEIVKIDLDAEIATIKNNSNQDINMTGWKLVSEKGNQTYNFSSGFILKAGASVNITSGKNAQDDGLNYLKWTSANTWNNDGDPGQLYDNSGKLVSSK